MQIARCSSAELSLSYIIIIIISFNLTNAVKTTATLPGGNNDFPNQITGQLSRRPVREPQGGEGGAPGGVGASPAPGRPVSRERHRGWWPPPHTQAPARNEGGRRKPLSSTPGCTQDFHETRPTHVGFKRDPSPHLHPAWHQIGSQSLSARALSPHEKPGGFQETRVSLSPHQEGRPTGD